MKLILCLMLMGANPRPKLGVQFGKIVDFIFLGLDCSYIDGLLLGFVKIEVWGALLRMVPCLFTHVVRIMLQFTWVILLVLNILCIVNIVLG